VPYVGSLCIDTVICVSRVLIRSILCCVCGVRVCCIPPPSVAPYCVLVVGRVFLRVVHRGPGGVVAIGTFEVSIDVRTVLLDGISGYKCGVSGSCGSYSQGEWRIVLRR